MARNGRRSSRGWCIVVSISGVGFRTVRLEEEEEDSIEDARSLCAYGEVFFIFDMHSYHYHPSSMDFIRFRTEYTKSDR